MGSLEELFVRVEEKVSTKTFGGIRKWLAGEKRDPNSFNQVSKKMARPFEILIEVDSANNLEELNKLDLEVDSLVGNKEVVREAITKQQQLFKQIEIAQEEVSDEISEVQEETRDVEEEKSIAIQELESQRDIEIEQIDKTLPRASRRNLEKEIIKRFKKLEKKRLRDLNLEEYRIIKDTLEKKQKLEAIIRDTKDRRKRENAKRNLLKLSSRLKER